MTTTTTTTPAIDLSSLPPEDPQLDRDATQAVVFEDATASAAKVISRKGSEVRVVFAGNRAATNGNTIVIPKMGDGKVMKERHVKTIRGYADHESAHVLLSDPNVIAKARKEHEELISYMTNAVEDVRIEKGFTSLYPGSKESIMQTADYAARMLAKEVADNPGALSDPMQIGPVMITMFGRKRLGMATPAMEWMMNQVPADQAAKYEKWVDALMGLPTGCENGYVQKDVAYQGCKQAYELAKLICGEMKKEQEEQEPNDGGGGNTPMPGGGGADEGTVDRESAKDRGPISADLDDAIEDMAQEINNSGADDSEMYRPFTRADDLVHSKHGCAEHQKHGHCRFCMAMAEDDITTYQNVITKFSSHLATMKRKLERALLAKAQTEYETGLPSGKLDKRRLVDVVQGRTNVFRRKEEGADLNTAVTVLVDLSGSMRGTKARVATQTAIALSQPLDSVGIPFEVLGFHTGHALSDANTKKLQEDRNNHIYYSRLSGEDYFIFKSFDETLREARPAMSMINNCVGGCNHDGEAVMWAAMRLMKRREQKKVLIVLSDGQPAGDCDFGDDHLRQHLRDVASYLESLRDFYLVGIGIMTDAPKHFYRRNVVLHDLSDLSKSVLDQLGQVLVSTRFKVDNADLYQGDRGRGKRAA